MTVQAVFNGTVIAESDATRVVEGNHYFPPDSVHTEYLVESRSHSLCVWKGLASYYTVSVGSVVNADAAWYYPKPSRLARGIKNYVAFWKGVEIRTVPDSDHVRAV